MPSFTRRRYFVSSIALRDALVATVSHELRTPLTSISGFLEMMEDEEHALGDAGRQYLDVIRRATERLHALVEDLLLVAQIEAQRIDLQFERVDLNELATRAAESAEPSARDRQIHLDVVTDHRRRSPATRNDSARCSTT